LTQINIAFSKLIEQVAGNKYIPELSAVVSRENKRRYIRDINTWNERVYI
jgi:hypothetical protein